MASATATLYNTYTLYANASTNGVAQINHDADTFRLMLLASASAVLTHSAKAQVSADQIVQANYPEGGIALANVTITIATSGTATFDADNVIVTASGGDMSARAGVIYRDGTTDPLMIFLDFQGVQQADDGTTFNVNWSADGIVQMKPQ